MVDAAGNIGAGARRASGDGPDPKNCIEPSSVSSSESAPALTSNSTTLSSSSLSSSSEPPSASRETSSGCGSPDRAPCTWARAVCNALLRSRMAAICSCKCVVASRTALGQSSEVQNDDHRYPVSALTACPPQWCLCLYTRDERKGTANEHITYHWDKVPSSRVAEEGSRS
jgi:hypothetical protein